MPDLGDHGAYAAGLLERAVQDGVCSAAVLFVQDLAADRLLLRHVVGRTSHEPPGTPITGASRFDLASLTKRVTATSAVRLASRGELDLDAPVAEVLRGDLTREHAGVTPRHLLAHAWGSRPRAHA